MASEPHGVETMAMERGGKQLSANDSEAELLEKERDIKNDCNLNDAALTIFDTAIPSDASPSHISGLLLRINLEDKCSHPSVRQLCKSKSTLA